MAEYHVCCLCIALSVCLRCISCETADWIRLKLCTVTEVCPGHHVSHFGGNCLKVLAEEEKISQIQLRSVASKLIPFWHFEP